MTLKEMQDMQREGKGRIYWYYEDHCPSSNPEPIWVSLDSPLFSTIFSAPIDSREEKKGKE